MRLDDFSDVNRYRIDGRLAEGGMGAIYRVKQLGTEGFEKTMALKIILDEYTTDPEFVEMFIGEAKLVADLIHENIVQVYQLGRVQGFYYIAMELIDGVNLTEFLLRHRELEREIPIETAAFITSRVCRALEYAHNKTNAEGGLLGVVHRDVSPANIMMNFEGVVKLTDFGIAKARGLLRNQEGEVLMGKIRYMSPEQAQYMETDGRSDIFSLGLVLWEMLTGGEGLFDDADTEKALHHVAQKEIPPIRQVNPKVPEALEKILLKALERDLTRRYQSAGTMGFDLEYYMYHDRYGPTNLTLEKYVRELFPDLVAKRKHRDPSSKAERLSMEGSTIALILEDLEKKA